MGESIVIDDEFFSDGRYKRAFQEIRPFNLARLYFKGGGSKEIPETADQQALAEIMANRFAFYRDNYGPAEDEYFESVDRLQEDVISDNAAGISASASSDMFADVLGSYKDDMTSRGIDPSSGQFQSATDNLAIEGGKVTASNVSRSRSAIDDQYVTGLSNIVAIGNGKETDAIGSFSDIAQTSGERATDKAINSHNNRSANMYVAGQVVGAGGRALMEGEE